MDVHSSFVPNSPKQEITWPSVGKELNKLWYVHSKERKEQTLDIRNTLHGSQGHCAELKRQLQRVTNCVIPLHDTLKMTKLQRQKTLVVARW